MFSQKNNFKKDVDLRKYTSIKIGGKAKCFYTALSFKDLSKIIQNTGVEFYLLGKGSNLLIESHSIKKPIIKLGNNFNFIRSTGCSSLVVGAATPLSRLIRYCLQKSLGGIENLAGIPATIGGLLAMNASSFGESIFSSVKEVSVMSRGGEVKKLKKEEIDLEYRSSNLKKYIILEAELSLSSEKDLKSKVADFLKKRFETQDFNFPSCGCIFKNTSEFSAGFLIDSCSFKGQRRGDAQVSTRHANFIINLGSAKYKDVIYLIQKIKDQVYKKYSIILDEEIKYWR